MLRNALRLLHIFKLLIPSGVSIPFVLLVLLLELRCLGLAVLVRLLSWLAVLVLFKTPILLVLRELSSLGRLRRLMLLELLGCLRLMKLWILLRIGVACIARPPVCLSLLVLLGVLEWLGLLELEMSRLLRDMIILRLGVGVVRGG